MTKNEQWHKAIRAELNRNERTDIGTIQKALAKEPDSTKEQIDATPTELDCEVPAELFAEINNFLYVYDWVDVLSESELASLRIQLVHFMSNREAQAHAAGVREGLIKAAKIFDEKAELLSEDADELGAAAAQEIRALIKE